MNWFEIILQRQYDTTDPRVNVQAEWNGLETSQERSLEWVCQKCTRQCFVQM